MSDIFISYSRESRAVVNPLVDDLRSLGFKVWLDQELSGGQAWWDHILERIRGCDIFVAVLSEGSLESVACTREHEYADALGKPIVPVLVSEGVSINLLPPALARIQYVDYRDASARSTLAELNRAINNAPPSKGLPDPLPPPPKVPASYLGGLAQQIGKSELSYQEQTALLIDLKLGLFDATTADDARKLLERLRARPDLFAKVSGEIDELLEDLPGASRTTLHERFVSPANRVWIAAGVGLVAATVVVGLLRQASSPRLIEVPSDSNRIEAADSAVPTQEPQTDPAPNATAPSEWLPSAAYNALFSEEREKRRYPTGVEGRLLGGEEQYRASWIAYPAGSFCFGTYHGMTRNEFNQRDSAFRATDYRLEHEQSFEDAGGVLKYQATWSKQSEPCLDPLNRPI